MQDSNSRQAAIRLGTHGEDYGNWMPVSMLRLVRGLLALTVVLAVLSFTVFRLTVLGVIFVIAAAIFLVLLGWITWIRKNDDRKADRNHFTGTVMGRKSGNYEDLQCIGAGGSGIPADHTASVS